jgi:hypothetical protein
VTVCAPKAGAAGVEVGAPKAVTAGVELLPKADGGFVLAACVPNMDGILVGCVAGGCDDDAEGAADTPNAGTDDVAPNDGVDDVATEVALKPVDCVGACEKLNPPIDGALLVVVGAVLPNSNADSLTCVAGTLDWTADVTALLAAAVNSEGRLVPAKGTEAGGTTAVLLDVDGPGVSSELDEVVRALDKLGNTEADGIRFTELVVVVAAVNTDGKVPCVLLEVAVRTSLGAELAVELVRPPNINVCSGTVDVEDVEQLAGAEVDGIPSAESTDG